MVELEESSARIPLLEDLSELGLSAIRRQYLGILDGHDCY